MGLTDAIASAILDSSKRTQENDNEPAIHTTIELSGVKLEVIGTYYPGEDDSMDCPGEDASIEIDTILTPKGDDISGLFADYVSLQTAVEELTIQAHIEGVLCAAEDHADCVRKGGFK